MKNENPRLFEGGAFAPELFHDEKGPKTLQLEFVGDNKADAKADTKAGVNASADGSALAVDAVQSHRYDAAVYFPPDFAKKLADYRKSICENAAAHRSGQPQSTVGEIEIPQPQIVHTTASERSQLASERLTSVLGRWTEEVGESNLEAAGVPVSAVRPFDAKNIDLF